jgi:hypothetical protein
MGLNMGVIILVDIDENTDICCGILEAFESYSIDMKSFLYPMIEKMRNNHIEKTLKVHSRMKA